MSWLTEFATKRQLAELLDVRGVMVTEAPDRSEVLVLKNFACKFKRKKKCSCITTKAVMKVKRTEPSITMINSDIIGIFFQKAAKQ